MPPESVVSPRQNGRGLGVIDNGHQHLRSDKPPARWQAVGKISRQKLGRLGIGHLKHMPDLLDEAHSAPSGKKTPPLHRPGGSPSSRSEEHTSELQSLMRISYAVFCWKKKTPLKQYECPHMSITYQ